MSLDEETLRALFDRSQKANPEKMQFSEEESARFQKSFEDPEFRKLFADYMDELQDPKNREETEAYISQLEGEQKVPEGKELIRPEPAFVAKSFKIIKKDNNDKEKVFLNIVKSDKINVPSKTSTPKGTCWSVPYSLGPPHMEKDKNGSNAPCFDCCFHPDAIALGMQHKEFKDLLVTTAMEGVEKLYQQQGQDVTINREFHIVKGLNYKQGPVPTMMIAVAAKENWKDKDGKVPIKDANTKPAAAKVVPAPVPAAAPAKASDPSGIDFPAELEAPDVVEKSKTAAAPAIKKGFLTNSKGAIYGDKLTTLRKKVPAGEEAGRAPAAIKSISLVDQPASGGLGNLNIPSGSTAAKPAKSGSGNGLIQEVKKGDKPSPAAPAGTVPAKAAAPTSATSVGGLTAVSTTKRMPAPASAAAAVGTPLSPSGRREVAVTSPSGSEVLDSESPSPLQEPEQLEGGLERPRYTMKERGLVSMGDFENLNTAARSNRPSELVFRVELPKIAKASLIVLDIAERQLNLSYPDMYLLSVRLPYPVFDTKGTAKYDKASKSLTVTLPVRPPPAAPVGVSSSPAKQAGPVSTISSEESSNAEEEGGAERRSTPAKKASSVGHGRWVESCPASKAPAESSSGSGDAPEGGLSLHEEIKRQAEIALREAQAAAAAAKSAAPIAAAPVVKPMTHAAASAATATIPPTPAGGSFIASSSFAGKKAGYVFKKGDQGVGYYMDTKSAPTPAAPVAPSATPAAAVDAPALPSASVSAAVQHVLFPFECRQTKPALAIIVEVPNIDKASLRVEFEPHSVRVSFRAFADVPVEGTTASSVGAVLYGSVLQLREADCPGGLDVSLCRFDAQKQNLAIVLTKALPQYWHSSASKREAVVATGESKSGDITSDETRSLFSIAPFADPAVQATFASADALPPPPAAVTLKQVAPTSTANAEIEKALKSLESTIQVMQFSSSDALFELD